MPLSQNHLQHRCLINCGGHQCRYLDVIGWNQGECRKRSPGNKKTCDTRAQKHIAECKKYNAAPHMPVADGGSCKGYLYLPKVTQGYDQVKN